MISARQRLLSGVRNILPDSVIDRSYVNCAGRVHSTFPTHLHQALSFRGPLCVHVSISTSIRLSLDDRTCDILHDGMMMLMVIVVVVVMRMTMMVMSLLHG